MTPEIVSSTPLRGLNGNSDLQRRTPTGKILLASPSTAKAHAQHLRELEKLNEQNSKLRRDIQKVQQSSRLLMSRRRDSNNFSSTKKNIGEKKTLSKTDQKMDDLSPMEREKMTTTIEIWQRHHDRKISPSASSIGGQSSVPQAVAHDEITSQDSVDAIEERALEQSSMQPDDSSSNIYAKHVEAYAHEISELRNQLSTYDQKIDTITKTCEQRVQIVEQALRQAQSSNKSTPSFNYFGTIGFSSLTFLFFIGASALLVADLCHQFPNDLHRATH